MSTVFVPGVGNPAARPQLRRSPMTPARELPVHQSDPFDLHALSVPAGAFTGDFYFVERHGSDLWMSLGDVAGKGIHAAIFMAMLQEELEERMGRCAVTGCDPAQTMSRLHEVLRPVLPSNRFATAVIARLSADGTLLVVNAGHCPPLVLRARGAIEEIGSTGPAIGILPVAQWCSVATRLEQDDTFLLYSDGLVEARSAVGEELGLQRVRGLLSSRQNVSARDVTLFLSEAVSRHSAGVRDDDLTLLAVRNRGVDPV